MYKRPRILTIAGSDSGGGAGIQADLKTISALGCYGTSVITALTAQNTQGVDAIESLSGSFIYQQLKCVLEDIGTDATKIGMVQDTHVVEAMRKAWDERGEGPVVLDPVMVAKSGDRLLRDEAIASLKEQLFPIARLITPNIPEAEVLSGQHIRNREDLRSVAESLGSAYHHIDVLIKGGHFEGDQLEDVLYLVETNGIRTFEGPRVRTRNDHGTGCTLSSAIASFLGLGHALPDAVEKGRQYLFEALEHGKEMNIGNGHGPPDHFYFLS